jgi:hypothetical protein
VNGRDLGGSELRSTALEFLSKGESQLCVNRNMFAAARQRIRKKPAVTKNLARRRRRGRVQSTKRAAELHEELVSHLTAAQLARLKAEFTKLDGEGFGFLSPKDLLPV